MARDVDIHGIREALRALDRFDSDSVGAELRELLDDLRHRGEHYIRLYAPSYTGELLRRIGSSAPFPTFGTTGTRWQAEAGVRGRGREPLYVHGGTGVYRAGSMGLPIPDGGLITSNRPGKPMRIQKRGEPPRYRMWARGQRANPFVFNALQQLLPYARGKIRRLFNRAPGERI